MKLKVAVLLFFTLGILFALTSIVLSLQTKVTTTSLSNYASGPEIFRTTTSTTKFDNIDFGALATGIISAACFLVAGKLIIKTQVN